MKKLVNIIAPISTAIIFGIIVTIMFSVFDVTNRLTPDFWTTTLLGTALTILTTLVWFPVGVDNGKKQKEYITAMHQYSTRAEYIVSNQMLAKLNEYCDKRNEEFAKKLLKNKLSQVCVSIDLFENYKKLEAGIEINDENVLKELGNLTKKQIKRMNKLKDKEIKFAPLTPAIVLKMKNKKGRIKPINYEKIYKTFIWTGKLIWSMCSFAVLAFVTVSPDTNGWLSKVFQLLIWAVIICFNIYMSINSGSKSITEYRKNYYLCLSTECARFFEWMKIPLNQVDVIEVEEVAEMVDGNGDNHEEIKAVG